MASTKPTKGKAKFETDDKKQLEDDEAAINRLLNDPTAFEGLEFEKGEAQEKADNAIDFEDFSDDELPDEETPVRQRANTADTDADDSGGSDMDDLLFEGNPSAQDDGDLDPGRNDHDDLFGDVVFENSNQIDGLQDDVMNVHMSLGLGEFPDMMDISEGLQERMAIESAELSKEEQLALVKQHFPAFKEHAILDFPALFRSHYPPINTFFPKVAKPLVPAKFNLDVAQDQEKLFRASVSKATVPEYIGIISIEDSEVGRSRIIEHEFEAIGRGLFDEKQVQCDIEMACSSWDAEITPRRHDWQTDRKVKRMKMSPNYIDMSYQWSESEFDLEQAGEDDLKAVLDLNDPYLLLEVRQPDESRKPRRIGGEFRRQKVNKDLTQRYNISNDEAYDLLKENHQSKVRSTIGQLSIEHSMPAIRLQTPYYRTRLSKHDARSFHRQQMVFTPEVEIRFTKMKNRKKKTMRGKDVQAIFDTTKSLSLSDNAAFILMEYSEEHPYVLSNFGMGSRIINYYRRKTVDDESRPKQELGELQVLMKHDRSPFWNFGSVDPGETVPALYNRMVRAPIFKHTPKSTDFLVIRNSDSGGAYYYIRTIPHLFVVGQTFPVVDVPGPHSRKVTTASKNRLRMVCYRVIKRKDNGRISVKDISPHFPENNDMQNRQKMKEFMSFQKEKERGYWQMKLGEIVPDEATIRSMVTPETVCLLDAMQVGVRYLEDAGYGKAVEDGEEDEEKDGMSVEQQLAPWIATRNFLNATSGKAMLKLHGEGDPSGRGEAFSFVRTSMKGGFKAIGESVDEKLDAAKLKALGGHSYNVARQQASYEEAIDRIWKAQQRSLSSTEEQLHLDLEDGQGDDLPDDAFNDGRTPRSEAVTPATWMGNAGDDETASQFSRLSATNTRNKHLKIYREVQLPDGTIEKQAPVIIKDSKVIRMYLRRRLEVDSDNIALESLLPTGNEDEDKRNKRLLAAELSRLKRNKERREARERQTGKKGYNVGDGGMGSPVGPSPGLSGKHATTRKCANCGQTGHIKTNKKVCPAYNTNGALRSDLPSAGPSLASTPVA